MHINLMSTLPQVLSHEELREALAKEKAPLMQARASYDFLPQTDRELPFRKVHSPSLSLSTAFHVLDVSNTFLDIKLLALAFSVLNSSS